MILCRHRWCFRPIVGYSVWCRRHTELVTLGWEPAPMSEQSKIEQIDEITNGDFSLDSDHAARQLGRIRLSGSFGQLEHLGDFDLILEGKSLTQVLDNWLTAARAIQAAFEDGPVTEPAGDADADVGVSE